MLQADNSGRSIDLLDLFRSREDDIEGITVPFFDFEGILAATDNFSDANKLGEGSFGPVYKVMIPTLNKCYSSQCINSIGHI